MAMRNDLPSLDEYGQLWMAVLALAVEDATKPIEEIPACDPSRRTYSEDQWNQRRAVMWIQSRDTTVGSMEWICSILNLDPAAIRSEYQRRVRTRRSDGEERGTTNSLEL